MNEKNLQLSENIVNKSYINLARNSLQSRENMINTLLSQRGLPENGWDDLTIEYFLNNLAAMDTNNFPGKIGVGERESRIYSSIVEKRNFSMGHGIGRSGDIAAIQPKAAGSSLVLKLAKFLTKDALKIMGLQQVDDLLLMPLATGMSLSMVLLAFQSQKKQAKYVIWSRIDQKTCLKCIKTINLEPVVVEGKIEGDEIVTDTEMIEQKIQELGRENVLCVLSTTSCFAPRTPDDVEGIAKICQKHDIYHLVNNAYGLQCQKILNQLNNANNIGKVDAVVQSTDKNFMVPVGGSIIFSFIKKNKPDQQQQQQIDIKSMSKEDKKLYYQNQNKQNMQKNNIIDKISEMYPGRASAAPIMDLFITLLSMGKDGLQKLLRERQQNIQYAKEQINKFTQKYNEKLLNTPKNSISMAITLKNYSQFCQVIKNPQEDELQEQDDIQNLVQNQSNEEASQLGAFLYSKRVMGSRILTDKKGKKVCGIEFKNYGSHSDNYPQLPYITVAIAIGMDKSEIDVFLAKLEECLIEFGKKQSKNQKK